MRSSNRAAAVVELFVRAVFAERRAQKDDGDASSSARRVTRPPPTINVWRWHLGGVVS
ncbi:MAG: hypothetical protein ABI175_09670 [Polyangiales bacterium]